jgi:hypothetical protein
MLLLPLGNMFIRLASIKMITCTTSPRSISFQIPEAKEEVEQGEARWPCFDADEQEFNHYRNI